jgi:REP element-mobilizing transposase RayT
MGHPLRCNLGGRLVEVTCRTQQGRFLMRPSSGVNSSIRGTLGRAQRYTGLPVCAVVFLSNHYHLLVVPDDEKQLSDFMRFTNTNLSKQLGRLHGWRGALFARRYRGVPVSDEDEAQVSRLRYILEHGVKEGLVLRPEDWPGVHSVSQLLRGQEQIHGIWQERTAIWKAHQRGEVLPREQRITREVLRLSPIPALADLSREERIELIQQLLFEIEQKARDRHRGGARVLGAKKVRAQDPHDRPQTSKRSPAPVAHAATVQRWLAMKIAYREFVSAYREAAERRKAGLEARFPGGCFPPRGPFVPRDGPARI